MHQSRVPIIPRAFANTLLSSILRYDFGQGEISSSSDLALADVHSLILGMWEKLYHHGIHFGPLSFRGSAL